MAGARRARRGPGRHRALVCGRGLALNVLDRWTIAYTVAASTIVLVRFPAGGTALVVLGTHGLLAGCALLAPRARRGGPWGQFAGAFYPLFALVALYTCIGMVNRAAGVAHDPTVQAWDAALFGGQPSRHWIRAQPHPWLSALLHGAYLSYYAIVAAAPLGLWVRGRRAAARRAALVITATFYVCYAIFLVFPVAGPRYAFPPPANTATAVWPALLTHALLDRAAAWGTAFPSSHVAAAFAAAGSAWQAWRPLGAVLWPPAGLLALGTVYGQLHYAVDAVAGVLLAGAVLALHPPGRAD